MRSLTQQSTPVILLTIVMTACTTATGGGVTTTPAPATTVQPNPAGVAQAKADSVRHPYTEADVQFMYGMIGHHAQAIVMATGRRRTAPALRSAFWRSESSTRSRTRSAPCSAGCVTGASPCPKPAGIGMKMMMNGVEHDMLMPGMLTDDQMKQLDARGVPSSTGCS